MIYSCLVLTYFITINNSFKYSKFILKDPVYFQPLLKIKGSRLQGGANSYRHFETVKKISPINELNRDIVLKIMYTNFVEIDPSDWSLRGHTHTNEFLFRYP